MEQDIPFAILVVDDEPPICELLSRVGQKVFPEARFTNTKTLQETLDYLDDKSTKLPQLVLLDIDLNQAVDGLDLLPQLMTRFNGHVPIVVFSNIGDKPKVREAYERGAVAYTQKPDELLGWQRYVARLREYWYETTLLPTRE